MKILGTISVLGAALVAASCSQPPDDGGRPQRDDRGGRHSGTPHGPYLDLFDTDEDGQISTKEMNEAVAVLKKLDSNKDGVLTPDELPQPPRPGDERGGHRDNDGPNDGPPPRRENAGRTNDRRYDGRENGGRGEGPPPRRDEGGRQRPELEEFETDLPAGTVQFRGGHETDRRDGGRPVVLIASALGVKTQVFRDAFSNVNPARGGDPSPARARMNKDVLMAALGEHGITNDRLDEVSNYYRYQPQNGGLWAHKAAKATAIIEDGNVTGFRIIDGGSGYSSVPDAVVAGHRNVRIRAEIEFTTELRTNGRLKSLTVVNDSAR